MILEAIKKDVFNVVGAIFSVHQELGPGLNEHVYQEGLELELKFNNIPFSREITIHPEYKGTKMKAEYRIDFLCHNNIIIECKAIPELTNINRAQLFNYMRLMQKPCGVLVNFYPTSAEVERYFFDEKQNEIVSWNGQVINLSRSIIRPSHRRTK
jgi:GxxExxY protein